MAADQCGQNRELISFREWAGVLAGAAEIPAARRETYRDAIIAFLGFCKRQHAGASVILIKAYLAQVPEQARSGAREALRWWYRAAQGSGSAVASLAAFPAAYPPERGLAAVGTRQDGGRPTVDGAAKNQSTEPANEDETLTRSPTTGGGAAACADGERQAGLAAAGYKGHRQAGVPPPRAAADLGGPDWERDLIKACRERGFLWRTEETYRGWAGRFAAFLRTRSPYAAGKEEVGAFLSHLAVTQRASGSTQKQALNAIVFLMQEALHRDLGRVKGFAPRGFATE